MASFHSISNIEVEAKFQGAEQECERIIEWFEENGFAVERKEPVHRVHVYFDDSERLRAVGCRLRCIIAPREWCRYDFKADDPTGRGETAEFSLKKLLPVPLSEAIAALSSSLPESAARTALLAAKDSARVILVMTGTHQKFLATSNGLDVEISRDLLVPLISGIPLSEIEIELVNGSRTVFDSCIQSMENTLGLTRNSVSKLERALAAEKNDVSCNIL